MLFGSLLGDLGRLEWVFFAFCDSSKDKVVNSIGLELFESFVRAIELPLSFDSSVFSFVELALKLAKLVMLAMLPTLAAVKALGERLVFGGIKGVEFLSSEEFVGELFTSELFVSEMLV